MEIIFRNEYALVNYDLTIEETECFVNLSFDDYESEEDFRKAAQEVIDIKFNRPEYNETRKLGRHRTDTVSYDVDGEKVINADEALYQKAINKAEFTKFENEKRRQARIDEAIEIAKAILKEKEYKLFMAITYEGYSEQEYAEMTGDSANNVSHKYRRILRKIDKKRPFYTHEVAYK